MQHRAWLMPGFNSGSNSQAGSAVDIPAPPAGKGLSNSASMGESERQLRHCLGLRARRWAMFEFVTPPIDRAFYEEGSMAEYLQSLGLHQVLLSRCLPVSRTYNGFLKMFCDIVVHLRDSENIMLRTNKRCCKYGVVNMFKSSFELQIRFHCS
jgi:hypothetical protein